MLASGTILDLPYSSLTEQWKLCVRSSKGCIGNSERGRALCSHLGSPEDSTTLLPKHLHIQPGKLGKGFVRGHKLRTGSDGEGG